MIGPLVVIIGLLGLWALYKGKAGPVLDAISKEGFSTSLQNSLGNLNLGGTTNSANIPGSNGPSSSGGSTGLYNVQIQGPNGSGLGTIQVVAHDAASAIINASQGGNTPVGPATMTHV